MSRCGTVVWISIGTKSSSSPSYDPSREALTDVCRKLRVALAAKRVDSRIPLWQLFIAVQFLDVLWSALNLIGVERSSIYPAGGASKLTFTNLPWTHGLLSSLGWSLLVFLILLAWPTPKGSRRWVVATLLGAAVWSHFWLDVPTHRADLPLIGDSLKIGLGLYSSQIGTFIAEAATLIVGIWLHVRFAKVN